MKPAPTLSAASIVGDGCLTVRNVAVAYGGVKALRGVGLDAAVGRIHGLIGPNGAGKTTLLNVLSGVSRADHGTAVLDGTNLIGRGPSGASRRGISRTFQNIQVFDEESAYTNVLLGAQARDRYGLARSILGTRAVRDSRVEADRVVHECLALVGLDGQQQVIAGSMPYGTKRMLEIARALGTRPKILLLDEPAAGLNSTEKRELAQVLRVIADSGIGLVLVEHDMDLVMSVSQSITVLSFGEVIASGDPETISKDQNVIRAYLGVEA